MAKRNAFEKILSRPEIASLLEMLGDEMDIAFSIRDEMGKTLFSIGTGSNLAFLPLNLENVFAGTIHAPQAALAGIEKMVRYILKTEMEKILLSRETLDIYREISYLYDFADSLSTSLEVEEIARQVIQKSQKAILGDKHSILLLGEKRKLDLVAESVKDPTLSLFPIRRIVERILQSGNGEIVSDIANDPCHSRRAGDATVSIICVPLKIQGKATGVILVSSKTAREYPAEKLKLLTMMASQVAIFIENARLYSRLKKAFIDTVYTLADTIEKRDPYTGGHTRRVMEYSLAIGEDLNLASTDLMNLRLAAILHDIGKIGVKDHILRKGGGFTRKEFQEIKQHPLVGEKILKNINELNHLIPGIKSHHERFDGTGYPEGLQGEEIPLVARIISVADAFDAMTSDRPYRQALTVSGSLTELRIQEGTQFDPQITRSFCRVFKEKKLRRFVAPHSRAPATRSKRKGEPCQKKY